MNVANTDRLTKELEKFQGLGEELAILQEDFLLMEQKWLAEQKRKKYYEEVAVEEEKKSREMSQQLYMLMTNELTPASLKVTGCSVWGPSCSFTVLFLVTNVGLAVS